MNYGLNDYVNVKAVACRELSPGSAVPLTARRSGFMAKYLPDMSMLFLQLVKSINVR